MSKTDIYTMLRSEGMTHAGACGMMGNMMAESSMQANIAQRGMTSLSDADYTAKYDADPESCIYDSVGYGLCQWTFWSRKRDLSRYAQNLGVSVGNEEMQVKFAVQELKKDYSKVWRELCSTDDINAASDRVCADFERPAVNNFSARRAFAREFDAQFSGFAADAPAIKPTMDFWAEVLNDLDNLREKIKRHMEENV